MATYYSLFTITLTNADGSPLSPSTIGLDTIEVYDKDVSDISGAEPYLRYPDDGTPSRDGYLDYKGNGVWIGTMQMEQVVAYVNGTHQDELGGIDAETGMFHGTYEIIDHIRNSSDIHHTLSNILDYIDTQVDGETLDEINNPAGLLAALNEINNYLNNLSIPSGNLFDIDSDDAADVGFTSTINWDNGSFSQVRALLEGLMARMGESAKKDYSVLNNGDSFATMISKLEDMITNLDTGGGDTTVPNKSIITGDTATATGATASASETDFPVYEFDGTERTKYITTFVPQGATKLIFKAEVTHPSAGSVLAIKTDINGNLDSTKANIKSGGSWREVYIEQNIEILDNLNQYNAKVLCQIDYNAGTENGKLRKPNFAFR